MLYPQDNLFRQMRDLSGFWNFRFDPEELGNRCSWFDGFDGGQPIAVPASWNEQFADSRDYLGTGWYQTRFHLPWGWQGQRIYLRFNSVNYYAEAWLNGHYLGNHEGGHLPFVFDITDQVRDAVNLLIVRVNGELAPDHVPPGGLHGAAGISFGRTDYPDTSFDFFPYCGIQRPVLIYAVPQEAINDLTVITEITGTTGVVKVKLECSSASSLTALARLDGHGVSLSTEQALKDNAGEMLLEVPDAALWSPSTPNLYHLSVELRRNNEAIDRYTLRIGIRTIAVEGDQLLLNGQPLRLLGFGRHEDFPIVGRGLLNPLIVKDYELLRWVGANSFRTSHYPYSEQMMDLADELGFLVIDETPAVGLFFTGDGLAKRSRLCEQYLRELIARDKNHPSVIMWSLANEPHTALPEARQKYYQGFEVIPGASHPAAVQAFKAQADLARSLDPSRLVTLVSHEGALEEVFEFMDVVCLNRYFGWYSQSGQIEEGVRLLEQELELIHRRYPKPFVLAEFGADTIPGHHANPPEMFSEEYQAQFLTRYIQMLNSKPYVVGQHVWNMCDFKTAQGVVRMGAYNYKGVFTRDRRPKMAAHRLRELWRR